MPVVKLPINTGSNKAFDEVGLKTVGAALRDGVVDRLGNVNRRPGLSLFTDLSQAAGCDGLYWWSAQSIMLAIVNGKVFKITNASGANSDITGAGGDDDPQVGTPVTFADFGTNVYIANGSKIINVSTSTTAALTDAQAPTAVTHVAVLDRYLICTPGTSGNKFFEHSVVNDPTNWTGTDFFEAEAKPDAIKALSTARGFLYIPGAQTLEVWQNDGITPFVPLRQRGIERGIIAPYSWTLCTDDKGNDTYFWLDNYSQVVRLNGSIAENVSPTMTKHIQSFSTVTDARGSFLHIEGTPYYMLDFPTERKTLTLDLSNFLWYEWGQWDTAQVPSDYDRFLGGAAAAYSPDWNLTIVGSHDDGKLYKISGDYTDDAGATLRTLVRTANMDHGSTNNYKRSNRLTIRCKRTTAAQSSDEVSLQVRWYDDGAATPTETRTIVLKSVSFTDFEGTIWALGRYRVRKYEFILSESAPLLIVYAEEDIMVQR